nr:DUF3080 domain-containing protein [uncultured Methylophaga sp.]
MNKKVISLLSLVLLMTACDKFNEPDSMMDEYLVRLARVLDQPVSTSKLPALTKLPDKKQRMLDVPQIDVNMLEFLSLYGCELQVVVAERNSILGRVMLPINRLRYEMKFIHSAKLCLNTLDDEQTRDILKQAIAQKSVTLPLVFWNAVWSTEEITELMTYSKGYLPTDTSSNHSTTTGLQKLLKIKQQIDNQHLDTDLQQLGKIQQQWLYSHHAGKLLKSAQLLTARLNDATQIIEARLAGKALCYQQRVTPQAEIVRHFFFNIYIGKVQPYMAAVTQQSDEIFPLLNRLAQVKGHNTVSVEFNAYRQKNLDPDTTTGVWQQLHQAVERHTQSWQRLLEQCGMRPGVESK